MIDFFRKLFTSDGAPKTPTPPATHPQARPRAGKAAAPTPRKTVELEPRLTGRVVSNGPGKNVLIGASQNGERATDGITDPADESADELSYDADDKTGIDPYNTGEFDRSKNWDKRYR